MHYFVELHRRCLPGLLETLTHYPTALYSLSTVDVGPCPAFFRFQLSGCWASPLPGLRGRQQSPDRTDYDLEITSEVRVL